MLSNQKRRPRTVVNPRRLSQMTDAFMSGASLGRIAADNAMSAATVREWLKPVIALLRTHKALPAEFERQQGGGALRPKISPERVAEVREQIRSVFSIRQLAKDMDLDKATVKAIAMPVIASMREDGSIGRCQCGRERFHSRFCTKTIGSGRKISPERKQAVVAAIMTGKTFHQISSDMKFADKSAARSYLKFLTPEQRSRRKALETARRRETSHATSFRPYRDDLYAEIAQVVPRWLSDATRDDAISDIYLAVLEGDLQRQDIGRVASRFGSRAASQWESKFGPKSLDEAAFEGSRETIGDMIPDADSLEPLEHRLSAFLVAL